MKDPGLASDHKRLSIDGRTDILTSFSFSHNNTEGCNSSLIIFHLNTKESVKKD
jgi:hypothetical protein